MRHGRLEVFRTHRRLCLVLILVALGLGSQAARGAALAREADQGGLLPDPEAFDPPLRGLLGEAVAAVTRDPGKPDAWGRLGMLCHAHLLRGEARRAYGEAAKLAPNDPRWPHLLGILCDQLSLPDEAASAFSRALEIDRRDLVALCSLGRIEEERGRDDAARKRFIDAVKVAPKCVAARVGLGELALRAGVLDMAEKNFNAALEESPRCGPAHAALARILKEQGKEDEAAFHRRWGEAASSRVSLPDPLLEEVESLGVSYEARMRHGQLLGTLGRFKEAAAELRAAAELKRDLAEPRYLLGLSLIEAGEVDSGLKELEKLTSGKERQVDAWVRIARGRAGSGDLAGALTAAEAALKLAPENADALIARGEIRCREKKLDLGLADFERALALEPRNEKAHVAKGEALLVPGATREEAARDPAAAGREAERARAASLAFRRALEIKADLAEAYEGAGRAAMQEWDYARGDVEKAARVAAAIDHFRRAVQCFPERKSGHIAWIKALYSAGRVRESVAAIQRAHSRWPDDPRFQKRAATNEEKPGGNERGE